MTAGSTGQTICAADISEKIKSFFLFPQAFTCCTLITVQPKHLTFSQSVFSLRKAEFFNHEMVVLVPLKGGYHADDFKLNQLQPSLKSSLLERYYFNLLLQLSVTMNTQQFKTHWTQNSWPLLKVICQTHLDPKYFCCQ